MQKNKILLYKTILALHFTLTLLEISLVRLSLAKSKKFETERFVASSELPVIWETMHSSQILIQNSFVLPSKLLVLKFFRGTALKILIIRIRYQLYVV